MQNVATNEKFHSLKNQAQAESTLQRAMHTLFEHHKSDTMRIKDKEWEFVYFLR
jgi:hypothetical protein